MSTHASCAHVIIRGDTTRDAYSLSSGLATISDMSHMYHTALIWQKEASDKSEISRKRAKCVCHLHWRQWNIMMSYLTYMYLLVGWVFLHEIWPGRRAHYVNYENINNSNFDGMSLASFCQSRAAYISLSINHTVLSAELHEGSVVDSTNR